MQANAQTQRLQERDRINMPGRKLHHNDRGRSIFALPVPPDNLGTSALVRKRPYGQTYCSMLRE